jgi:hypothetical protein
MDINKKIEAAERLIAEYRIKRRAYNKKIKALPKGSPGRYGLVKLRAKLSKEIKRTKVAIHSLYNQKYRLNDKDPINAERCENLLSAVMGSAFAHSLEENQGHTGCTHEDYIERDRRWALDFIYGRNSMRLSRDFYLNIFDISPERFIKEYEEYKKLVKEGKINPCNSYWRHL